MGGRGGMSTSVNPSSVARGAYDAVPVVAVMPSSPRLVMVDAAATCQAARRGSGTEVTCPCNAAINCPLGDGGMQDENKAALARSQADEHAVQALMSPFPRKRTAHASDATGRSQNAERANALTVDPILETRTITEQVTNGDVRTQAKVATHRRAAKDEDSGRLTRNPGVIEENIRAELSVIDRAAGFQRAVSIVTCTMDAVITVTFRFVNRPQVAPASPVPTMTTAARGSFMIVAQLRTAA